MNCATFPNNSDLTSEILDVTTYIPPNLYWIYLTFDLLELISILVSIFVVTFGLVVFLKDTIFHPNLMRLFLCSAITYYFIIVFRIMPIIIHLLYKRPISSKLDMFSCVKWIGTIEQIRFGLMASFTCCIKCIATERFLAIYRVSTYENNSYSLITVLFIVLQVLCGIFAFFLVYYKYIELVILVGGAALLNVYSCLFFMMAERINKYLYDKASKTNSYTLTQRYQMSENVRTTKVLKRSLAVSFILILAIEICTISNALTSDPLFRQISLISFNYLIVIYSLAFVIVSLSSHDSWRRESAKLICKLKRCFVKPKKVGIQIEAKNAPILFNISGQQMKFDVNQERDIYFTNLTKMWNDNYVARTCD